MNPRNKRRVVVVTGATGGLGASLCRAFGVRGDAVAVHAHRNVRQGEQIVRAVQAAGGEAALFQADVRDAAATRRMFEAVVARWGPIDVFIHAAAVTRDRLLKNITDAEWDDVIGVNLSGAFFCLREAARAMTTAGAGHIILIASRAAQTGRIGQAAYTASKMGVIALARCAAWEWPHLQVNAVMPGLLPSPMTDRLSARQRERIMRENAPGPLATRDAACAFIVYLSGLAGVSGQVFNLDRRMG